MSKRRTTFKPPTDVTQWWQAPHCGPGSLDSHELCGFCDDTAFDCALRTTTANRANPDREEEDGACCGGSGFWCHSCGRFWAQDSCGERYGSTYGSADGAELRYDDGIVYCCCGTQLFRASDPD